MVVAWRYPGKEWELGRKIMRSLLYGMREGHTGREACVGYIVSMFACPTRYTHDDMPTKFFSFCLPGNEPGGGSWLGMLRVGRVLALIVGCRHVCRRIAALLMGAYSNLPYYLRWSVVGGSQDGTSLHHMPRHMALSAYSD